MSPNRKTSRFGLKLRQHPHDRRSNGGTGFGYDIRAWNRIGEFGK